MALTALIAAYREARQPARLRAMLGLAGRMLLERQVRLAIQAEAKSIIILAERLPGELAAAIESLRSTGAPLRLARTPAEATETLVPDEKVLIMADGAVAEFSQVSQLAQSEEPALLTVPDGPFDEPYERIDAETRWAGLALCRGDVLIETAAMLRDWDFLSTLLRRMLQSGARCVPASAHVAILESDSDAGRFESRLIASAWQRKGSWAEQILAAPERLLTQALMGGAIGPAALGSLATLLSAAGAGLLALGWLLTGFLLLLVATPLEGSARRLAQIRLDDDTASDWWSLLLPVLAAAGLLSLANALMPASGWGMMLLALVILAFLGALAIEKGDSHPPGDRWLAERRAMIWSMLPFALANAWGYGLAFLFAYVFASFFHVQRWVHSRPAPAKD
jgi:hypothetical protein